MMKPLILLTAGGTGGHLFPAEALANALKDAGAKVALATDKRANAYAGSFPADEIVEIPSATPSGRSPLQMVKAALLLGRGTLAAVSAIRRMRIWMSCSVLFSAWPRCSAAVTFGGGMTIA